MLRSVILHQRHRLFRLRNRLSTMKRQQPTKPKPLNLQSPSRAQRLRRRQLHRRLHQRVCRQQPKQFGRAVLSCPRKLRNNHRLRNQMQSQAPLKLGVKPRGSHQRRMWTLKPTAVLERVSRVPFRVSRLILLILTRSLSPVPTSTLWTSMKTRMSFPTISWFRE